jgi:hypothetical protein
MNKAEIVVTDLAQGMQLFPFSKWFSGIFFPPPSQDSSVFSVLFGLLGLTFFFLSRFDDFLL